MITKRPCYFPTLFALNTSHYHDMATSGTLRALKSSNLISWKPTGKLQQTIARSVELSGVGLHSGKKSTATIFPELAGKGRYFDLHSNCLIPASIDFVHQSPLCTTLVKDKFRVRTVEHLLSALEATNVDNCLIRIDNFDSHAFEFEVPILDGSARQWVEAIEEVGLVSAEDECGTSREKLAPYLNEPVHVWNNDSFIVAFPSLDVRLTYGINFPQVSHIGCQWFSFAALDGSYYAKEIAPSRTFCIYEEVDYMRGAGLIKGGSLDNAIVCSARTGWLNPPLRFCDEPCRHKILDLVGDLSLFSRFGDQGLPVAHIIAYKGGHALHADFVSVLNSSFKEVK